MHAKTVYFDIVYVMVYSCNSCWCNLRAINVTLN